MSKNIPRLRLHPFWLALGWCFVLAVVYFSLTARPPEIAAKIWDKANHLASYAWLAYWFAQIYPRRGLGVGLALIALGITLEILQGLGGARQAEALDALANSLGVALGLGLAATPLGRGLSAFEGMLLRMGAKPL